MTYRLLAIALYLLPTMAFAGQTADSHIERRIAYINSYHSGYEWTDRGFDSFKEGIGNTQWIIFPHFMNTKINTSPTFLNNAAKQALDFIEDLKPHLIIAAEDNAAKLLIKPHFRNHSIPVIFIGVNINASQYGFPAKNITGLIEMDRVENLVKVVRHYFKMQKAGMIFSNTTTSTKKFNYFNQLNLSEFETVQVNDAGQWRQAMEKFNHTKDFIVLDTISGITALNHENARDFIVEHMQKPVVTTSATSRSLAHMGYINIPEEHGNWAAQAALRILGGVSPQTIPIEHSRFYKMFINQSLIDDTKLRFPARLYKLKHERYD